jgi:hypothetical protein
MKRGAAEPLSRKERGRGEGANLSASVSGV